MKHGEASGTNVLMLIQFVLDEVAFDWRSRDESVSHAEQQGRQVQEE